MKTKLTFLLLGLIITFFSACNKDTEAPEISDIQIGFNNTQKFYTSYPAPIRFLVADNKELDKYEIVIEKSGNTTEKHMLSEWSVNETFDLITGQYLVYNLDIAVPGNADTGNYRVIIKAYDTHENVAEAEAAVHVEQDPGYNLTFDFDLIPEEGSLYETDHYIQVSGTITSKLENLSGVLVVLRKYEDYIPVEEVSTQNSIVLKNASQIGTPDSFDFSCNIKVGSVKDNNNPANVISWESTDYYLLVLAKDALNTIEYPTPVNIQIEVE